jgi:pyruvate dehydrogenase E1 component alpha subunit
MFARGVPLNEMVATMAAKANGFSGGRETSHHAGVPECGVVVGSGIVGSSIAIATGVGLGLKVRGSDAVVVDFFGDGAASRGDFHEAINMAAVMKLPVIYVCENNLYALATPIARQTGNEDIYMRAAGYGIPGLKVDGNDVLAVYEATQAAIQRARAGGGPTLIECKTYRWRGHCEVPSLQKEPWRPNEEVAAWRQRCPIRRLRELILERGAANEQRLGEMETRIERELVEAIAFAAQSPDPMPEDALHGVYADEVMRS